nr:diguanylate cyclase [Clostridium ganghwense]
MWINREYSRFNDEAKILRNEYIQNQQILLKNEVNRIIEYIEFEKAQTEAKLKEDIVQKHLQDKICKRISQIRFGYNNDQYIFIVNYKGIELVNGMFPKVVGKNLWDLKDDNGIKFVQEEIMIAKQNPEGAFTKQNWFKKNSDKTSEKLYFVKAIPEWQWVIGTGIYTDEIEAVINAKRIEMEKEVKTRIIKISIIVLSLILLVGILAKIIKDLIDKSFKVFFSFFEKASSEYVEIDVDKIYYSELKQLANSANNMIKERNEIENKIKEMNNELKKISITDGLTGLYNHKYMYENLEKEIKRANEEQKPLSIIMLDIDHFKKVNDIYGHQCGDKVLETVAKCIETHVGQAGIVGRYGGEEFLSILPQQNLENTYKIAEKIRKEIKELIFDYKELRITISGGVVQLDIETPIELVKKADELLYSAKANGRDRIEI